MRLGSLGLGGLMLADLLRLRAAGAAPRAKSVIMVILRGGPSHIDMYDPKPDAPPEIRGEFQAIRTRTTGMLLSEHLPRQAALSDKLAIVRNMKFTGDNHSGDELTTGWRVEKEKRPAFGAIASRLKGGSGEVPNHMVLSPPIPPGPVFRDEFTPLYVGPGHRAFSPIGDGGDTLSLLPEMTQDRLADRKSLLQSFDSLRRDLDGKRELIGMDQFTQQAFALLASNKTRDALDISLEPERVRDKYGINGRHAAQAARWLQALRLVEAGVPVVSFAETAGQEDWDTHAQNFANLRNNLLPKLDRGVAALVSDLHERGLANDVAVVVWGEMGRTPRVSAERAGRDHWSNAGFALLAGAGWQTGQVIGKTNAWAEAPVVTPYRPQNVLATLYQHLGIDLNTTLLDHAGRPQNLLDDTTPIKELF